MSEDQYPEIKIKKYTVNIGPSGCSDRIDLYLSSKFSEYSRTFVKKLIEDARIKVRGKAVKPSYRPSAGDIIEIEVPAIDEDPVKPENIEIDIIYEDRWIMAINKPYDMVVHPSRGHSSGTLVNAATYHCEKLSAYGGELRPGIVHRLDRDTTGVIIMVKDDTVHRKIARQFEDRTVNKEYLAICHGTIELDSDLIDEPIGKHCREREKMAIRQDTGKPSTTLFRVRKRVGGWSVVSCYPRSGRTHQIRVHLKHIGHPIVCDPLYGRETEIFESELTGGEHHPLEQPVIERQALHARRIEFIHPALGKKVSFEAPVPPDMKAMIDLISGLK